MGPRTARETAWLKAVPRAMAEGLTGGRSAGAKTVSDHVLVPIEAGMAQSRDDCSRCASLHGSRRHHQEKDVQWREAIVKL